MKIVINGADVELGGRYAKTPLPWALRDVAGLHGTRFGCIRRARRLIRSGAGSTAAPGVSGALTMPATSLQAASEEVVKRDPGLTRAQRSSRTSLIPSASLVI